ncbi:MAG: galactose ABC transporter substrate-binding protein [Tissierellia bacterium]|nr:galactose ABC transporter substrate-binding protein [Tissierellia bacterium]
MKLNKRIALILAIVIMATTMAACGKKDDGGDAPAKDGDAPTIGVLYYNYGDAYISTVRNNFEEMAAAEGFELNSQDAQNDQAKQNDELDNVISKGAECVLVNIVDTGAAPTVIEKVKAAGLPLILFNREPEDIEVYKEYDLARFVGTNKPEAGVIQGEMIAKDWADGKIVDRNGNGKLDYVMLHGGLDNAEAIARTKYSVETIEANGIEVNEIGMQIAAWDTEQAKNAMDAWIAKDLDNIDVVIANNDSMAIGAINALKASGYNVYDEKAGALQDSDKLIPAYGVDATEEAQEAISQGIMAGTVKQDAEAMAKALITLAKNAVEGKDFLEGTDYEYDESGFAVRIPYQPYTGK